MSITWNKNRPAGIITPAYTYQLAEDSAYSIVGVRVEFPPGGSTAPHSHGTASVIGYCVSGTVLSAMNDREAKVYKAGESFYEPPGSHHRISDNASTTESAVVLATFIIKTAILEAEGPGVLVVIDEQFREGAMEQRARQKV